MKPSSLPLPTPTLRALPPVVLAGALGLLCVWALLSEPAQPARATRYYISDALGSPLEEVGWYRREEFPYLLVVEPSGNVEIRRLLHEGRELRRWEREPSEEREFVEGVLSEQRLFDARGRLREERLFAGGALESRRVLHYGAAGISRAETFDGEGRLVFEDEYLLSSRGELLRLQRRSPEGTAQELALGARAGRVYEERYAAGGQTWVNRYDVDGRLIGRELWLEGALAERQELEYGEKALSEVRRWELAAGRLTLELYDGEGRLSGVRIEEKGRRILETRFQRDEQGRLVEKSSRGAEGLQQWQYFYAADGRLEREVYTQRRSLRSIIHYEAGDTRVEELYRDGEVVLRVLFRGGLKLREESLERGVVVRVKEYQ